MVGDESLALLANLQGSNLQGSASVNSCTTSFMAGRAMGEPLVHLIAILST